EPGGDPGRGGAAERPPPALDSDPLRRDLAGRSGSGGAGTVDRPRALRHAGWRAHVEEENVLQLGARGARVGLRAAAGASGDRRCGRLVQSEWVSRMTALAAETPPSEEGTLETPSGKGRSGENFPVGSWLIRKDLRPHVHAFYRFARNADDIA